MIYSKSCEYAIRALVYLATQPQGQYSTIREISNHESIPVHFLGKLLQQLVKFGLLISQKGRTGGFALALPADEIPLIKVVEHVDGLGYLNRCVIGLGACDEDQPCPAHAAWFPVKQVIMDFLEHQTIGKLSRELQRIPTRRA